MSRENDPKFTPNFGLLDTKISSPSGLFLSPYSPFGIIGDTASFDRNTPRITNNNGHMGPGNKVNLNPVNSKNSLDRTSQSMNPSSNPTTPRKSPTEANRK